MHRYDWEPEKYILDTAHLDETEDLVYRRLLDHAYITELPLIENIAELTKKIRLGKNRVSVVKKVLEEFFFLVPEKGWQHKKVDSVLGKIYQRSDKARESANSKWDKWYRKNSANAEQPQSDGIANADRPQCEGSAKPLLLKYSSTQVLKDSIISSSNDDSGNADPAVIQKRASVPYEKLQTLYNSLCPRLRGSKVLDDKTKRGMKKTWDMLGSDIRKVEELLVEANKSDFLAFGRDTWKGADIEFIFRPDKAKATLEGKYSNNKSAVDIQKNGLEENKEVEDEITRLWKEKDAREAKKREEEGKK